MRSSRIATKRNPHSLQLEKAGTATKTQHRQKYIDFLKIIKGSKHSQKIWTKSKDGKLKPK